MQLVHPSEETNKQPTYRWRKFNINLEKTHIRQDLNLGPLGPNSLASVLPLRQDLIGTPIIYKLNVQVL